MPPLPFSAVYPRTAPVSYYVFSGSTEHAGEQSAQSWRLATLQGPVSISDGGFHYIFKTQRPGGEEANTPQCFSFLKQDLTLFKLTRRPFVFVASLGSRNVYFPSGSMWRHYFSGTSSFPPTHGLGLKIPPYDSEYPGYLRLPPLI